MFINRMFVSAVILSASSLFAAEAVTLVGTPTFSTGCGGGAAIKLVSGNKVELVLPDLQAVTTGPETRVRKNCVVSAVLKAPPGYKIAPQTLHYEGAAAIAEGGSGNITARYYLSGTESLSGYERFAANFNNVFSVTTEGHSEQYTACGGEAEFNFMSDVVVRSPAHVSSEIVVHRGNADTDVAEGTPVVQCGMRMRRCF